MKQSLGLWGATGIGVGAIVGGGILALAGVAFQTAGPGAVAAFALNGLIAFITALSFAEMSSRFPESGGSYVFAKKVLTVRAAFAVGWVVWMASIVAAVLYAMGFASYAVFVVAQIITAAGNTPPEWLEHRALSTTLAVAATAFYGVGLVRKSAGGGQWETIGKTFVFAILIAAGLWALRDHSPDDVREKLTPFLPTGGLGLFQAMGYTFIALQGFDLIAAVGGEVKDPGRTIPRAMMLSLAIALVVYIPLLLLVATVGVPEGQSIVSLSAQNPETVVAVAAERYMGVSGLWLVSVAALLAMVSALQANLFAASRVAQAMANDRTLPRTLGQLHPHRNTPFMAIAVTSLTVALIVLVIPNVAAAGAAASLIFLLAFALAHWTSILARLRGGNRRAPFHVPWFPLVPISGGLACVTLAIFQAISVPVAGAVVGAWLVLGGVLYAFLFARRARVVDAWAEASDPQLVQLRGRNPLVLVPIANPASAAPLVAVANALATPAVGRVLLLSIVHTPEDWQSDGKEKVLRDAQEVLGESLAEAFAQGLTPEALTTIAREPWPEIARVARLHRCESLLLGFGKLREDVVGSHFADLVSRVDCDVVSLRAPREWRLSEASRVLLPIGGKGTHDELRARLLGSLGRSRTREITYVRVMPPNASDNDCRAARRDLDRIARDEVHGSFNTEIVQDADAAHVITERARQSDLVILGMQRLGRRRKTLGALPARILADTECAVVLISRRG